MIRALSLLPAGIRRAVLRHQLRFREQEISELRVEVALSGQDALAAGKLVHDAYVKRGLMDAHPSSVRLAPTQHLPSSFILVAKHRDRVVGTVSLQADSEFGLSMDDDFAEALAPT